MSQMVQSVKLKIVRSSIALKFQFCCDYGIIHNVTNYHNNIIYFQWYIYSSVENRI